MTGVASLTTHPEQSDAHWHRSFADLEAGLRALRAAPKEFGRLTAIVRRPGSTHRESLESAELSVLEGLPGDAWNHRPNRSIDGQLTVINSAVAELIANGQPTAALGDNLFVDLDLSAGNLPVGTRLSVGAAVVEVTPMPHNGCRKFLGRFGADALRLVQAPETRAQNYRGIYWKVVQAGRVCVGDPIRVLARPTPDPQFL